MINKRNYRRSQTAKPVELRLPSGQWIEGELKNVSNKGLAALVDQEIQVDSEVEIRVSLAHLSVEFTVSAPARVLRSDATSANLELISIDLDNHEHWRNLVEYNLDPGPGPSGTDCEAS